MKAAERHNFTVVEDDIFCDLQAKTTPRLATLDQLNRVIYARSFSKTLSGSLRVGFVACAQNIFNVTVCEETRVQRWLQRQAAGKAA
jgi:DNA-binding transcriptional MocR family regulator